MRAKTILLAWLVVGLALAARPAGGSYIAYINYTGATGSQEWGGPLGMDFDVNSSICITHLGVFDSGADGLGRTLTAQIWDRTDTSSPLAELEFTSADAGTLIDSSRFKLLPTPLDLSGGEYAIVAYGYGSGEPNGNEGAAGPSAAYKATDDGGGLISFVGTARYGSTPGEFPGDADTGPANRYSAGTFAYTPEPAALALLAVGGLVALRRRRRPSL